jgi:asparagine synthase (glutamine-hydrolysing)
MWHKKNSTPDERRLQETARLLAHRGPDNYGIFTDAGIGLVHTRLSLLDLNPRSNQPFWDKQERYCLVYNGEIYNFKELRAELEELGVQFRTTSDTEVLLEWIINCGVETTLPKLEGMFAFALYDKEEKTLTLARDRFGIKPLFIYDNDDAFIFASEINAMRPWINFEPDLLSISSFLYGFAGPTKGHSFYKNVKSLPPGTLVRIRMGEYAQYSTFFSLNDFWDPDQLDQLERLKPQQIIDKVEELLLESVKKQLFADAPVGALCSGGVDSSIIMAMAAKFHNNLAVFHANVEGPLSEYEAAATLAKHLKLDLKTVAVHDRDFIDAIPEVIKYYGHPFYITPHSVPFLMVSKLVRRIGVKAVLSGEGSDECYLGYDFCKPDVLRYSKPHKAALKKLIEIVIKRTKIQREYNIDSPQFVMGFSPYSSVATRSSLQHRLELAEIIMGLHNRFEVAVETEDIRTCVRTTNGKAINNNYMKSLDLLNYNLRALLHRNDSMGMAASIESRFPFLDSDLVRLAVNMPDNYKIRLSFTALDRNRPFFADKWVLRKVADRYLPRELSQRPKAPFPTDAYQRVQISPSFFEKSFIVDLFDLSSRQARYLIENAQQDLKLKLMHLDVWAHMCLNALPEQSMSKKLRDYVIVKPLD